MTTRDGEANRAAGRWGAAAVVGVAVLFTSVSAQAQIPITTCNPALPAPAGSKISAPGFYQLMNNIVSGNDDCIQITASNVSLKLNGYTIKAGVGAHDAIHVDGTATKINHVGIEGPGLITKDSTMMGAAFQNGIRFMGAAPVSMMGQVDYTPQVRFSQVDLVTVVGASDGIHAEECYNLVIGSNVIARSGHGIAATDCNYCTISGNDASGNSGPGIVLSKFSGSLATNNTVNSNIVNGNGSGIFLEEGVVGTRASSNVIDGNASDGIRSVAFSANPQNQFFSNRVLGNGDVDLSDDSSNCQSSVWSGNTFQTPPAATKPCLH
jgi:parallel beta-helix repeat protein